MATAIIVIFTLLHTAASAQAQSLSSEPAPHTIDPLKNYSRFLDSLDKADPYSIKKATEAYLRDIPTLDRASRDMAFLEFLTFYTGVCSAICAKLSERFDAEISHFPSEERWKLDLNTLFCSPAFERTLNENGMHAVLDLNEGARVDQIPEYVLTRFVDFVSPPLSEFLEFRGPELKEPWCGDGEIGISRRELAARVRKWECYIEDYPASPLRENAQSLFKWYFSSFTGGQSNSPVFCNTFRSDREPSEYKASDEDFAIFSDYAKRYPNGFVGPIMKALTALMSESKLTWTPAISEFLKEADAEIEKAFPSSEIAKRHWLEHGQYLTVESP